MRRILRPTLPAFCLSLLLPCALMAEEKATPPPAAAPPSEQPADAPAQPGETPPAEAPAEREPLPERSETDAAALEHQLPTQEQQQLKAGEESFLALWKPANVGEPSGIVILLPGAAESPDWPKTVGPLRNKLPDAGWHSLSLSLPDPQDIIPPPAPAPAATPAAEDNVAPETAATGEEATAPAPAPGEGEGASDSETSDAATPVPAPTAPFDPEEQRKAHAGRVLARIQVAVEFAQQQQVKSIVLLGHGSGAYWAARYLAEQKPAAVQNLLLVAAAMPPGFTPPLEELVPGLKLATGDFYYKDQAADRTAALKRQQAGKRQQHPAYVQVAMKALPGNPTAEQEQLYRRIRGWLSAHLKTTPAAP